MQVTRIYDIRDNVKNTDIKKEISAAIAVVEDAFEQYIESAKAILFSGETKLNKAPFDTEKVKGAMLIFRENGIGEIPDELTDEAVKVFVLKFGQEMMF